MLLKKAGKKNCKQRCKNIWHKKFLLIFCSTFHLFDPGQHSQLIIETKHQNKLRNTFKFKRRQNDANDVALMSLQLTLNIYFTPFRVSIVTFEQVNADLHMTSRTVFRTLANICHGATIEVASFKENTCARASFLIKLRASDLLKKRLWHRCFSVNFAKFLRTHFLAGHLLWLLLYHLSSMIIICHGNYQYIFEINPSSH